MNNQTKSFKRSTGKLKSSIVNLLIFFILMIICLPLAEIAYRFYKNIPLSGNLVTENDNTDRIVTFRKSENDVLIYEPIPNVRSNYTSVENVISSQGIRDFEYAIKKSPGTYRIIVLGDSIIYGWNVNFTDTFAKQLERELNDHSSKNVEVMNFGVPGYSTVQEIEMYRSKAKKFNPDLIILGYCLNDRFESSWEVGLFDHAYFPIYKKSYFVSDLTLRIKVILSDKFGLKFSGYKAYGDIRHDFRQLKEEAENVPVLVLIFPYFPDDYSTYDHLEVHKTIKESAIENGLFALDLLDIYREYDSQLVRIKSDCRVCDIQHPNKLGNAVAKDAAADFLRENKIMNLAEKSE